ERSGRPAALRVRAGGAEVTVVDQLLGPVTRQVDDLVLKRTDGDWAYNLAVVVDDHEQGVGEVVRGADLLEATPRQAWLHEALGYGAPPAYAHVPLVLGEDGRRLAKRHGAVTLADRAALGQPAADVRGELAASVGLQGPAERLEPTDLVARFDPAALASRHSG
ncbi:MAG: tRNA glutamyl-Q(34) synthetase GluQRS, partial [Solirubrobacterales bacterium]|nr:tRNA glutamyl-Q(34) synthetase GluQRS [Solirubrobacterales bacterium]